MDGVATAGDSSGVVANPGAVDLVFEDLSRARTRGVGDPVDEIVDALFD